MVFGYGMVKQNPPKRILLLFVDYLDSNRNRNIWKKRKGDQFYYHFWMLFAYLGHMWSKNKAYNWRNQYILHMEVKKK